MIEHTFQVVFERNYAIIKKNNQKGDYWHLHGITRSVALLCKGQRHIADFQVQPLFGETLEQASLRVRVWPCLLYTSLGRFFQKSQRPRCCDYDRETPF